MNTTNVLQKCIDALKADTPDLSYVRGMLETIIEMTPGSAPTQQFNPIIPSTVTSSNGPTDTTIDANTRDYLNGPIGEIG